MKKILTLLASTALLLACSENRENILKVYNWSDYIDESVIPEFEEWYQEQTGEPIHVIYQTFGINETMDTRTLTWSARPTTSSSGCSPTTFCFRWT